MKEMSYEFDFLKIIEPLQIEYGRQPEEKTKLHFSFLRKYPTAILQQAVASLLEVRQEGKRGYPHSDEFIAEIRSILNNQSFAHPDELGAKACPNGCTEDGFLLGTGIDGYTKAIPCDCPKGRKRQRALERYFRERGGILPLVKKRDREPGEDQPF